MRSGSNTEGFSAGECCAVHPELAQLVRYRAAPEGARRGGRDHPGRAGPADLMVLGRIVTMDPACPDADAMAVSGGRIAAIGSRDDLDGLRGPGTQILELGERVAMPGLVEPHIHLWSTVLFNAWTDCSAFASKTFESVLDTLRRAAAQAQPGQWIAGKLFDPSQYPGEPALTTDTLDQIAPDHPLVVANASMHFLYANSKALELAHITAQTPDPPGGRYFRENGHLTGVVAEMSAMMPVLSAMPRMTREELLDGLVAILTYAASRGVTKVHEAATGALLGPSELDVLHGLAAGGRLTARITTAQLDAVREAWEEAGVKPGDGDDMVRAIGWKVISDGSNQGRTGYLREPYLASDQRGAANCSAEEIEDAVRYAHDRGWQAMVHANGDAALDRTVDAYQKVFASAEHKDLRHRIEHCSLATDGHFAAMAEIGVSPSFLMNHVYHWGETLRDHILGPERASHLDRVASALRHGLRPSFHSDYDVSPISPLQAVQTAVTRSMAGGGTLNPAECISVEQALRAVTIDAAWQTHTDDVLGSLSPGKYADLVVLSGDPRSVDPSAIAEIAVHETRLGGAVAWSAE